MASNSFKVSFTLDEEDAAYFRALFRKAKAAAKATPSDEILASSRDLVRNVRMAKKTPRFVLDAVQSIEDLAAIVEDEDYRAPKAVANRVLGALAYFTNPHDLIPDEVPVLGFLDDAIMIRFVEMEFRHELAGYRKFRRFRAGAEQRPWTDVAAKRLPARLAEQRGKLRAEIEKREERDRARGRSGILDL